MIVSIIAMVLMTSQPQVQECGDNPRNHVVWFGGTESADLAPVGISQCSQSAWIQTRDHSYEIDRPSSEDAVEFYHDGIQVGPDWNHNGSVGS